MRRESDTAERRLPAGRKAELAAYVNEVGEATVAELAERFEVSLDTIRRDLDRLDADGILARTHGGAMSAAASARPDSMVDVRMRLRTGGKEQIAALAATLVEDNSSLIINGGTTALAVARALGARRDLTVVTNNLRLPATLAPECVRDIYMVGGTVRMISETTVGPVQIVKSPGRSELDVRCDVGMIAVGAVSVEGGYTTSNLAEATMMADMLDRADVRVILADASKFGRRLFAPVAALGAVDVLVTDAPPHADVAAALADAGVRVLHPEPQPATD